MPSKYLSRLSCRLPEHRRALQETEIEPLLAALSGWQRTGSPDTLEKTFRFADFAQVLSFIQAVGEFAIREDHHPTLEAGYDYCRLHWHSHDAGALTLRDFICAACCETVA